MGRLVLYAAMLALAAFVLSAVFVLRHGGGRSEAVQEVSLSSLVEAAETYKGEHVTTEGQLVRFREPQEHFVLQSDDLRVAVEGPERNLLIRLSGSAVRVTGRFDFKEGTGRFIEADSITQIR